jgi:hypothetical protein
MAGPSPAMTSEKESGDHENGGRIPPFLCWTRRDPAIAWALTEGRLLEADLHHFVGFLAAGRGDLDGFAGLLAN